VNHDLDTYLELLERRLSLLRLLAQEFVDCRKEFVALDLDGMYRRIFEQEELCREIQRLHPAIHALQQTCATQLEFGNHGVQGKAENAERAARLERVMKDLGEAQAEVGRLNQIHAAYLRRSRRTVQVLLNFIGRYAMTYSRPVESMATAPTTVEKG
jgi:flagellar FlgN protein